MPENRDDLKVSLKDNDFVKHVGSLQFTVEKDARVDELLVHDKRSLVEILNSDADFLASCNIIDYSLLLGEILDDPAEVNN